MTTTTHPAGPPPLPWEMAEMQQAAAKTAAKQANATAQPTADNANAPPQFADRAERDAYYRQRHYAGTSHPEATAYDDLMRSRGKSTGQAVAQNGAETLTLDLPPYMFPVLLGVSRAVGAGITTLKLIWHVFALITAIVLLGTLIGVLTA